MAVTGEMAYKLVGAANFLYSRCLWRSNSGQEQGADSEGTPFHVCPDIVVDVRISYIHVTWCSRIYQCWWSVRCATGWKSRCWKSASTSPWKIRRKCDGREPRYNSWYQGLNADRHEQGNKVRGCQYVGLC